MVDTVPLIGGPLKLEDVNNTIRNVNTAIAEVVAGGAGNGTVTSVSVTTANGVSGSVATSTTTPAITLALGAITPTSVNASGTVAGSNLSGTNTGDQNLFRTIAVAGQSDIVADSATDTLTVVAGTNITMTTNAGTDTLTINAAGGGSVTAVSVATANGLSGTVANPTTTPELTLSLNSITNQLTTTVATGTASGTGVAVTEYGDGINHSIKFTLTNVSVSVADGGVTGGFGNLLVYTFPAGTWLAPSSTGKVTLTAGAGGITDTAQVFAFLSSNQVADGATQPTTAQSYWGQENGATLSGGTVTQRDSTTPLAARIFTSHGDDNNGAVLQSDKIYLTIQVPNTLDIAASDTMTVSGIINVNIQRLGYDIP